MSDIALEYLNLTELAELIRKGTSVRVKRSIGQDRMIQILQGAAILPEERAGTMTTRADLQAWVSSVKGQIQSQLPCKGQTAGFCFYHDCPEGMHVDCLNKAWPHMKAHKKG